MIAFNAASVTVTIRPNEPRFTAPGCGASASTKAFALVLDFDFLAMPASNARCKPPAQVRRPRQRLCPPHGNFTVCAGTVSGKFSLIGAGVQG